MALFRSILGHKIISPGSIHKDCAYPQHKLRRGYALARTVVSVRFSGYQHNKVEPDRFGWLWIVFLTVFPELSAVIGPVIVGSYPRFSGAR